MDREQTNIIDTIYVGTPSSDTPATGSKTYTQQSSVSQNVTIGNSGQVSNLSNFVGQCVTNVSGMVDIQDVVHTAINESQIELSNVENTGRNDTLSGGTVKTPANQCLDKVTYLQVANVDDKFFTNMPLRTSNANAGMATASPNFVIPQKQQNMTTVQSGLAENYGMFHQRTFYDIPASACSQTGTLDEQGLKILADVISHRPSIPGSDNITSLMLENSAVSTSCMDMGTDNPMHVMQSEPLKQTKGCLSLTFPPDIIEAWKFLSADEIIRLTHSGLIKEEALRIQMKRNQFGLHLSIEGSGVGSFFEQQATDVWECAFQSDSSTECNPQPITQILDAIRARHTAEVSVQVESDMLSAESGSNVVTRKRGRPPKYRPNPGQQCATVNDGDSGDAMRMTRSLRSRGRVKVPQSGKGSEKMGGHLPRADGMAITSEEKDNMQTNPETNSQENNLNSEQSVSEKGTPPKEMSELKGNDSSKRQYSQIAHSEPHEECTVDQLRDPLVEKEQADSHSKMRPKILNGVCKDDSNDVSTAEKPTNDRSTQHYKHSIKSNRSFNKELYQLNQKVARSLKYQVPTDSQDYQVCIICGNVSRLRWLLLVHLRRFHVLSPEKYFDLLKAPPSKQEEELECLRKVQSLATKQHSPKRAGTLPCDYCGEEFLGIRNMKRHLKLKHGRLSAEELAEKISYYVTEYGKLIHRNRMIAIRKANLTQTEYPCRYCNLILSMSCTRSRHELYTCRKNPNRRKRFHCNYCGTAYRTKEAVEKHKAKHAQHDFKFVCDRCGKEYKTKPMLYEHKMKMHYGREPRFQCYVCEKSFHYKDKLEKHLVTHSDKRDVMCDICGKLFKTKADVQKHTKYVHEHIYPHHCDKCGHGVAKLSYLKTHKCGRVRRSQVNKSQLKTTTREDNSKQNPSRPESPSTGYVPNTTLDGLSKLNVSKAENATVPASTSLTHDNMETSSAFTMAGIQPMSYQSDLQQTGPVGSVEQFITDQCTDIGLIGPAAPSAFPVSQYVNTLPINTIQVYAFSQPQDVERLDPSDNGGLMQQQQQHPEQQQQQQQTEHIVSTETIMEYKMSPYQ